MILIAYRLSDKRVIKKFHNSHEAEGYFGEQLFEDKPTFSGLLYPRKFSTETVIASESDVLIVRKGYFDYVIKHGPKTYLLPASKDGILQKIRREIKKWRKKRLLRSA